MNLASGECRRCTSRPDHTAEPGDGTAGVRQLQREGVGARSWDVADGKGRGTVDRLGEDVAEAAINVQGSNGGDIASVAAIGVDRARKRR